MRRRAFLASVTAATGGLAGCLGSVGSGSSGTATTTADVLRVDTLDVGGSPGGTLPVRKPGSVTLLDFWATWCAPCKPQMRELRTVRDRFPGVHMLAITNESDESAVKQFWREYDGRWPVAMDPELRTNEEYGVTSMPTLIVLDPEGGRVWKHVGLAAADTVAEKLEAAGAEGGS